MQTKLTTFVAPTCTCCPMPMVLLPRQDIADTIAVCPTTGQLYQPAGVGYLPTAIPALAPQRPSAPSIQIDLSQSSYA